MDAVEVESMANREEPEITCIPSLAETTEVDCDSESVEVAEAVESEGSTPVVGGPETTAEGGEESSEHEGQVHLEAEPGMGGEKCASSLYDTAKETLPLKSMQIE